MLEHSEIIIKLTAHAQAIAKLHMRDLFAKDADRFNRFSLHQCDLLLDYSKNLLTDETLPLLTELAEKCHLPEAIQQLFSGGRVNSTENRPALHTALRAQSNESLLLDDADISEAIASTLSQMEDIVAAMQAGKWLGFTGKPITDVVNIGIGGSDLGPAMATLALSPYHLNKIQCHFVSNMDEADILQKIKNLDQASTVFIVASKSFGTQETICNATTAKQWLLQKCHDPDKLANHLIAITAHREKAANFGIKHILPVWDWVGGRFSLWSAIGLPIALAVGMTNFRELLAGAQAMDQHFKNSPLQNNMPVILGLLSIWYINFFNTQSHAVLPYNHYLELLPAYLQQLEMESNGKSSQQNGQATNYATSSVLWGMIGSKGQHAFHQMLHQGTALTPIDFIIAAKSQHPIDNHHAWLVANCLSQSEALMRGKTRIEAQAEMTQNGDTQLDIEKLLPHKVLLGNRPSNTIMMPELTPFTLGALLALYEHKTFVESVLWNINCFDQWGVELGKQLASHIFEELTTKQTYSPHDSSTEGLMNYYKKYQ